MASPRGLVTVLLVLIAAPMEAWRTAMAATSSIPFVRSDHVAQWHHGLFESVRSKVQKSASSLLHYKTETPLHVPLEINIVLAGFEGDGGYRYKMDAEELRWFMERSFPSHRPACMETGMTLEIEHDLSYNVLPVTGLELTVLEKEVKSKMVLVGERKDADGNTTRLYDVEATKLEGVFDRLYQYLFGQNSTAIPEKELERQSPMALFIFNFDKARMDPTKKKEMGAEGAHDVDPLSKDEILNQESGYIYRYRYNGGVRTQVWLSKGRYVVMDLSAGPCTYGRLGASEGAVGEFSVPRVRSVVLPEPKLGWTTEQAGKDSHDFFRGQLSSLIVSSIQYLFSPDVKFETVDVADRVLVPIIVLRNHREYNLLSPGHKFSIDLKAVETEVEKMVQPGQEVVVVGGTHSLHDHEKIAMAVSSAMRTHSVHEEREGGMFYVRSKHYLDGGLLIEELRHSADMLAAGLLDLANPGHVENFFEHKDPGDEEEEEEEEPEGDIKLLKKKPKHHGTVLPVKKDWQPRDPDKVRTRRRRVPIGSKGKKLSPSHGTRVIPVFVLSLANVEEGFLLEDESQVTVAHDSVIVLQTTAKKSIPLSYVTEEERIELDPGKPQASIIAGLASVLGGLAPPYERVSPRYRTKREDLLWAAGHHPFGPFSNTSSLSLLLRDTMMRNAIYSRVDTALHGVRESLKLVQAFSDEYLHTPFGEEFSPSKSSQSAAIQWLDQLYSDPKRMFHPIPHTIVENLHISVQDIEELLITLSGHLYDHELHEGHESSSHLLRFVKAFHEYVHSELSTARDDMRCCKVEHKVPMQHLQAFVYVGILLAGFTAYCVVIVFSTPVR